MAKSKGVKYVSKGERPVVASKWSKAVRADRHPLDIEAAKFEAYLKGKKTYFLVPTDSKKEPWKRVEGRALYGDPKKFGRFEKGAQSND
jgi:hypothetical protein